MTAPERPTRRPNARGHGDLLREEIVAAAAAMLAELGDDEAMSLRAVAKALGISPTSVYLHFPDRDALVIAAMTRCHADMSAAVDARLEEAARAEAPGPRQALRVRLKAMAAWALANPGLTKVMHESRTSPAMPFKAAMFERLVDAVHPCTRTDPVAAALDLRSAVLGAVSLRINEPGLPWDALDGQVDRLVNAILG
ncbi:TetR family transcriptional regulator [Actinorhabdospora filicis]|uniref:TetR family transcriptional regulator n=1 Tax=Actinorhabdospora filicis TaxID=1785913 RepID=A0A9W6WBE3_9ACTN|nr:TetR/AcrR family transcriptional regulator [Actinorhabdospora filicis]GLZ80539.1 TetR family transcriptional regulator [Actinorhabdospora filicis]